MQDVFSLFHRADKHRAFIPVEPVPLLQGQRNLVGKLFFQVVAWGETGLDASQVPIPIGLSLDAGENWRERA